MSYIAEIVNEIDATYASALNMRNWTLKAHGLARLVKHKDGSIPMSSAGESIMMDDNYSVNTYHRIIDINSEFDEENSFGDDEVIETENTVMLLVVYGNLERLRISNERFMDIMKAKLPSTSSVTRDGIMNIRVVASGIRLDSESLWNSEFAGVPFKVGPEESFFAVEYTVSMIIDRSCISACDNC